MSKFIFDFYLRFLVISMDYNWNSHFYSWLLSFSAFFSCF